MVSVSSDVTNFISLLQWKHNTTNDISSSSVQNAGVYQVYENGVQRLTSSQPVPLTVECIHVDILQLMAL